MPWSRLTRIEEATYEGRAYEVERQRQEVVVWNLRPGTSTSSSGGEQYTSAGAVPGSPSRTPLTCSPPSNPVAMTPTCLSLPPLYLSLVVAHAHAGVVETLIFEGYCFLISFLCTLPQRFHEFVTEHPEEAGAGEMRLILPDKDRQRILHVLALDKDLICRILPPHCHGCYRHKSKLFFGPCNPACFFFTDFRGSKYAKDRYREKVTSGDKPDLKGCVRAKSKALIWRFWFIPMRPRSRRNVDSSTGSPCKVVILPDITARGLPGIETRWCHSIQVKHVRQTG